MTKVLKFILFISTLFLLIVSIWPGSIIGIVLYGDNTYEPNLVGNLLETSTSKTKSNRFVIEIAKGSNHFFYYTYLSLLCFFIYVKSEHFKKIVYGLFFLSISLELLHFFIPYRNLELNDLIANILGVSVAYLAIKTYLFLINYER